MKIYHFKPQKKDKSLLVKIFVIVALAQVALLLLFAGYVVHQAIINTEQEFEAPPPVEAPDPSKKVQQFRLEKAKERTKQMPSRISVNTANAIDMPSVEISLPSGMGANPGFSAISASDIDRKVNLSGISFNILGVPSKGERIIICVDAGPHLMTDARGGLNTYRVIREEVKKLVNSLPGSVHFNLMVFELKGGAIINLYQPTLVPATDNYKRGVAAWLDPVNSSLNRIGAGSNNYTLKFPFLPQPPAAAGAYNPAAANRYRIYQAALEQGADTIYILTTGWTDPEAVKMPWTEAEIERFSKEMERHEGNKERELRKGGWTEAKQLEYDKQYAIARTKAIAEARKWIEDENKKRAATGQSQLVEGVDQIISRLKLMDKHLGSVEKPPKTSPQPKPSYKSYGMRGLQAHYEPLFKEYYDLKAIQRPSVNMIIFVGDDEEINPNQSKIIRAFTNAHKGNSRTLKGLKAVD